MEDSHAARVTGLYSNQESISDDSDIKKSVNVPAMCRKFGRNSAKSLTVSEEVYCFPISSESFSMLRKQKSLKKTLFVTS